MTDIFISYSRQDAELVSRLATTLEEGGYSVWWDVEGLHGGQAFASEIQEAINRAKCAIVVWSEASVKSNWVHSEATQADSQGILLTAIYQDAQIPLPFNNRHNESLRNWQGDPDDPDFQKLLKAIARYCPECPVSSDQQQANGSSVAPVAMPLMHEVAAAPAGEAVVLGFKMPWRAGVGVALVCTAGAYLILPGFFENEVVLDPQPAATQTPVQATRNSPAPTPVATEQALAYALTIEVEPKDADIRLPDIVPRYKPGILLKPGSHRVQISAPGYKSKEINVAIADKDRVISVKLKPDQLPFDPMFEPKMVKIPGGTFMMGCVHGRDEAHRGCDKNEKPKHAVTVAGFMMAETEVTVAQFRAFVKAATYKTTAEKKGSCWLDKNKKGFWRYENQYSWQNPGFPQREDHPVVCITREDAKAYLKWLRDNTGKDYRLPSEAQWEYAARGGNTTLPYPWGKDGKDGCDHANMADQTAKRDYGYLNGAAGCEDNYVHTAPVGSFQANGFKLHDMHGNVAEWVEDRSHADYTGAPATARVWTEGSSPDPLRMIRGGSWHSTPWYVRSAFRGKGVDKEHRYVTLGFRPVLNK